MISNEAAMIQNLLNQNYEAYMLIILVIIILLITLLLACKPWRFFIPNYRSNTIKATSSNHVQEDDDVERPLVSQDSNLIETQHPTNLVSQDSTHTTPQTHGPVYKLGRPPLPPQFSQGDSLILDISDHSENVVVGQTLKRPTVISDSPGEHKYDTKKDLSHKSSNKDASDTFISSSNADQRSILNLEVISGPSRGIHYSIQSTNKSKLPLTLGRVLPSDLLVVDSEVSGKHALINWNLNKLKWELVDLGSLNGTLLNSKAVHHPQIGSRHRGDPVELTSGDTITLGTASKLSVQITSQLSKVPSGVGVVTDPMSVRRGGKKLPMEDVCYYQWPLPGADQFGLFAIFDGHGGVAAASSASKIMMEIVIRILSDSFRRQKVLSRCDASDVLREAFSQTEEHMDNLYEGCTATVLLIWADGHYNYFAQCANLGDSACIANIDGKLMKMSEDHRVASHTERLRIQAAGEPLNPGETRLCGIREFLRTSINIHDVTHIQSAKLDTLSGLNLARMLGDKYLKEQDARFSSEPYVSQVVYMNSETRDFAIMASDGFWDVVNSKKAIQLVHQARERNDVTSEQDSTENIVKALLAEARVQRTKDNTSIIFLDFERINQS